MAQDVKQLQERINQLMSMAPVLSGEKLKQALNEIHSLNKQIREIKPIYYGGFKTGDPQPYSLDDRSRREIDIVLDRYKQSLTNAISLCESPIERLLGIWMFFYGLKFTAQFKIKDYRVDFAIKNTLIECDGYSYHDKTKEQATRDKKRDRNLKASGYETLRFTGTEIWANPEDCVKEIIKHVEVKECVRNKMD